MKIKGLLLPRYFLIFALSCAAASTKNVGNLSAYRPSRIRDIQDDDKNNSNVAPHNNFVSPFTMKGVHSRRDAFKNQLLPLKLRKLLILHSPIVSIVTYSRHIPKNYYGFHIKSSLFGENMAFVPSISATPLPEPNNACIPKKLPFYIEYVRDASLSSKLQMSSPKSWSSSSGPPMKSKKSSSSNSRGQTPPKSRVRGANAANQNRRGHSLRTNGDGNFIRQQKRKNTKRAPRWEREGDRLYAEVSKQLTGPIDETSGSSKVVQMLAEKSIESAQDVCEVLKPWTFSKEELNSFADKQKGVASITQQGALKAEITENETKSPPFLWGPLPVGPVLAKRLRDSKRPSPTSVQRAAFSVLTASNTKGVNSNNPTAKKHRTNAIIASPTGSGKTLAFLLPLLCTSPGGQQGEGTGGVLIVTPTIELACQIQREVDVLWPPTHENLENETNESDDVLKSSLFVVGANNYSSKQSQFRSENEDDGCEDEEDQFDESSQGRRILRSIGRAPLIAGTPKMLRMLYRDAERVVDDPTFYSDLLDEEYIAATALVSNLRAIVLDEADRLLRTEAVAREAEVRKERKVAQKTLMDAEAAGMDTSVLPLPMKKTKMKKIMARPTQTELLLRDLPIPSLDEIQFVCASATVGRTLRRQVMQLLGAPSAEAAATLVTGDDDARVKSKDSEKRKSVLLPETLSHAFRVVPQQKEITMKDSTIPAEFSTVAEYNDERKIEATINALWSTLESIEDARPTIIFPGKVGVERVQSELSSRGLEDVRTLRNLDGPSLEAREGTILPRYIEVSSKWKDAPVYIIGERFARGLDIPNVEYVIMLSPPSSAAGYTHMAGRTGRNGRKGTAITLIRPKKNEVKRFVAISDALGLKFESGIALDVSGRNPAEDVANVDHRIIQSLECQKLASEENSCSDAGNSMESNLKPFQMMSESALKRKKNAELLEYLKRVGHDCLDKTDKLTKEEMVSAIISIR
ncbi:hypothetical protein ACHAXS_010511 [Conticribra weissflogii]